MHDIVRHSTTKEPYRMEPYRMEPYRMEPYRDGPTRAATRMPKVTSKPKVTTFAGRLGNQAATTDKLCTYKYIIAARK